MNRLEEEIRLGEAGTFAARPSRLEVVMLDELGYLPFATRAGSCSSIWSGPRSTQAKRTTGQ
ncbi:hypothetical protein SPHINGOT1_620012 [Sphingomonas sp. T1]|nr:hypothetical protein SPHINGOT1_620012 [Sphingomonas sp. T1]